MERDLWKRIVVALKALPRRRPANAVYDNTQVLAVLLWAALHDRPISWACRRSSWPPQAWRRVLPDQSTMSRRMRDGSLARDLTAVIERVQRALPEGRLLLTDGKAYALEDRTGDADALTGWASGRYARGYKLHVIVDDQHRLIQWAVHPMNHAEPTACRELIGRMHAPCRARLIVGDAAYDSNRLHAAVDARGLRLIAPRRKPHTGLGWRSHHPHRLQSIALTERRGGWMWPMLRAMRTGVERFFAGLVSSSVRAGHLPAWVRSLRRARLWIGAKLAINAARIARNHAPLA